jgi:hypothetical protein
MHDSITDKAREELSIKGLTLRFFNYFLQIAGGYFR